MLYKPYRCTIWLSIRSKPYANPDPTPHTAPRKTVLSPGLCKALEQASVKHLICWEHFTNGGHFQWVMLIPPRLLPHRQFGLPFLHWVVPCTLELVLPLVTAKLLCFEWSPPWHFKTACWHHFCLKLLSRDFCPTNYPNHLFHLAGHCACQSVKQDIDMSVGHVK